jgi:hypothetical protein
MANINSIKKHIFPAIFFFSVGAPEYQVAATIYDSVSYTFCNIPWSKVGTIFLSLRSQGINKKRHP